MVLKLRQAQVWKHGDEFIRIVRLQRLEVAYMVFKSVERGGRHQVTSKKDFCRLLKSCTLVSPQPLDAEDDHVKPPVSVSPDAL